MKKKSKPKLGCHWLVTMRIMFYVIGGIILSCLYSVTLHAKDVKPKIYVDNSKLPSGFQQIGSTCFYKSGYYNEDDIDFVAKLGSKFYSCTGDVDRGFTTYVSIISSEEEGHYEGIPFVPRGSIWHRKTPINYNCNVEPIGDIIRVSYLFINPNKTDVNISVKIYSYAEINSTRPDIKKHIDSNGDILGFTVSNKKDIKFNFLFNSKLKDYTKVSELTIGDSYDTYEGTYLDWTWEKRTIAAGDTLQIGYLIGIENIDSYSNIEVTPDDPNGWNDLSHPHRLTLTGTYDSPAGLDGKIEYAAEDSEEWKAVTDNIPSGSNFSESIVVNFVKGRPKHTIRLRTVDNVGNTTALPSIEYIDIASHNFFGTKNYTYTGDSIYQSNITSDISAEHFTLKNYQQNVNTGVATFCVEGVFPYTIGRRSYQFTIQPQPLRGDLYLNDSLYVYNGKAITPKWNFNESAYNHLIEGKDYVKKLTNNLYPGTATLTIEGRGNYTSSLSAQFDIDKAQLNNSLYSIALPNEDITYDAQQHVANVSQAEGVGNIHLSYIKDDGEYVAHPTDEGTYTAYAEIEDGSLYYGLPRYEVGKFTIYNMDATEWQTLLLLNQTLSAMGRNQAWDITQGIKGVSKWQGVRVKGGYVRELNLSGQNITGNLPNALYGLSQIERLDLSNNHFTGNVGLLGQTLRKLKSLNASHNAFADLYPMLPTTIDSVNVASQDIDKTIVLDGSNFDVATIVPQLPTILAYNHKEQKYDTNLSLAITTAKSLEQMTSNDAWTIYASMANGNITIPYVSANNVYYGQSGDTLQAYKLNNNLQVEGSRCKVKYTFEQGDSNFKPGVDATDLQATILYAFGGYGRYPFNHTAADTYTDGTINVQDVVSTVNIILDKAFTQTDNANKKRNLLALNNDNTTAQKDVEAVVYLQNGKVWFYSEQPVSALSIEAVGNIAWNVRCFGLEQSTRNANMVAYSLSGNELPTHQLIELGTYTDKAQLLSASLANAEAQAINTSLDANAITAIHDVINTNNADMQIYNTKGIKTNKLQKGVNIIKQGEQINKVIIN